MSNLAPVMFIGHGSPMFALQPGKAGQLLKQCRRFFTDVKAVLIISPHWMTDGLSVTAADTLETIHDFYGFPEPLYRLAYNAPGSQTVAGTVRQYLESSDCKVALDLERGRDHGAWVPMLHLLPEESVPVLQLSLDRRMDAEGLVALGEELKGLRAEGIAIIASGSLTHNLYEIQQQDAPALAYVERFEQWVREKVTAREVEPLCAPHQHTADFKRAHPTAEHYLTLLIALGASREEDQLDVLEGGILHGVISMESYIWH